MTDLLQIARTRCEDLRREARQLEEFISFGESLIGDTRSNLRSGQNGAPTPFPGSGRESQPDKAAGSGKAVTDLVEIARLRRAKARAEIDALNQFILTADRLLRPRAKAAATTAPGTTETARPGTTALPHGLAAKAAAMKGGHEGTGQGQKPDPAAAKAPDGHLSEWMNDTFDFEQLATGAA